MCEPKKKLFIVDDDEVVRDTFVHALGSEFDSEVFESVEALHEALIEKRRPDLAIVDIHFPNDKNGGLRALELLRGLSPQAAVWVVSTDFSRDDLMKRLESWPDLRGKVHKGEFMGRVPEVRKILDETPAELFAFNAAKPWSQVKFTNKDEIARFVSPLGLDVDADIKPAVALTFPLDKEVEVMKPIGGLSGAIGLSVLVRSSNWRAKNTLYFLKICRREAARRELEVELDNYRHLRSDVANRSHFPKCFGIVKTSRLMVLVYEYVGALLDFGGSSNWEPIHFDKPFGQFIGGSLSQAGLQEALKPLGSLFRSEAGNLGRWPTHENREMVELLCKKAAKSFVRRCGGRPTKAEIERVLGVKLLQVKELEEIRLVEPERGNVANPLYWLRFLESDKDDDVLGLGFIHGDLHCNNLIFAEGLGHWMLIDFEHVRSGELKVLDAARLECDLLFRRMPLQTLSTSYQLTRRIIRDAGGLKPA